MSFHGGGLASDDPGRANAGARQIWRSRNSAVRAMMRAWPGEWLASRCPRQKTKTKHTKGVGVALHNEIPFELDICEHLAAHGWLYAAPGTAGDACSCDTPRALYPADLLA